MPSADRYAKYRADQTTVWISKNAQDFMNRERAGGEGTAGVLDRLIGELKRHRRANPGLAPEPRPAAKAAGKGAAKAATKAAGKAAGKAATKAAGKAAGKSATRAGGPGAAKSAAKAGAKRAASRSA